MDGSPKVITEDLENNLIKICRVVHNYSFDIFAHRVAKRMRMLLDIRGYIGKERERFPPRDHAVLMVFLRQQLEC